MSLHYEYYPSQLKTVYRQYLRNKYPELSRKSINTKVDDAFCMFRWMSEKEAWDRVQRRGDGLKNQSQFLADEFLSHRRNPLKDAAGYIRAIREFQEFLDLVEAIEQSRKRKPREVQVEDV